MNAPPAFQFYADDFIGGTVDLTAEDCGAYIRLLCYQWGRGKIPESKEATDRVAGCSVSASVMAKFPDGKNVRLESERNKQSQYRKLQSIKGKASAKARFNRGSTGHQTESDPAVDVRLQPEGNTPVSSLQSPVSDFRLQSPPTPSEGKGKPTLEQVRLFCAKSGIAEVDADWFWHKCEGNGWTNGGKPIRSWSGTLIAWKTAGYLPSQKHDSNQRNYHPSPSEVRNSHIIGADAPGCKARDVIDARNRRDEAERAAKSAQNGVAAQVAGPGGHTP